MNILNFAPNKWFQRRENSCKKIYLNIKAIMPNPYPKTLFPILKEITIKLKGFHDINEPSSKFYSSRIQRRRRISFSPCTFEVFLVQWINLIWAFTRCINLEHVSILTLESFFYPSQLLMD